MAGIPSSVVRSISPLFRSRACSSTPTRPCMTGVCPSRPTLLPTVALSISRTPSTPLRPRPTWNLPSTPWPVVYRLITPLMVLSPPQLLAPWPLCDRFPFPSRNLVLPHDLTRLTRPSRLRPRHLPRLLRQAGSHLARVPLRPRRPRQRFASTRRVGNLTVRSGLASVRVHSSRISGNRPVKSGN